MRAPSAAYLILTSPHATASQAWSVAKEVLVDPDERHPVTQEPLLVAVTRAHETDAELGDLLHNLVCGRRQPAKR